ncbi:MAG: hypothetical protein F6K00_14230 [Leptolyngbya sp. SIOISBB]|nr:hypothetical protein [Leptolyngbya sp. SIOISBB]
MKQLRQLTNNDLASNPIWECCGDADATTSVTPCASFADPDRVGYIARTKFILNDGSVHFGYCSPSDDSGLDYIQPVIIASGGHVPFWHDTQPSHPEPDTMLRLLGKKAADVFPVQFSCLASFDGTMLSGTITHLHVPEKAT